jgi:NADPH-dependent 7-cyano-7-deazaguanine reductase QueF-like protein
MDMQNAALLDTASLGRFTRYGNKYDLRATLNEPSGRSANVLTVGIVRHGEEFPRFITAFPDDEP